MIIQGDIVELKRTKTILRSCLCNYNDAYIFVMHLFIKEEIM